MLNSHESLNPEQIKAVKKTDGPVLILAGAGSGKTRTIVHRISYLIHDQKVPPWQIVAVTFTNKAAQEMQERAFEIAGVLAGQCMIRTYHSFGLYLLRCHAAHLDYPSSFTVWDTIDQNNALKNIIQNELRLTRLSKTQMKYLSNAIGGFKEQLVSPEDLLDTLDMDTYEFGDILPRLYSLYEGHKARAYALDFNDMIYQNVKLFEKKPEVLAGVQKKYRYFMVDEYQDTNRSQYVFVQMLVAAHRNICVVGDDDQAIYGWRGADVSNILDFNKDFSDAHVVKLEQNYRSYQAILDIANGIIKNNSDRMPKSLWTTLKGGDTPNLMVLADPVQEAFTVTEMIRSLSEQVPYQDIAVLYRTNAQSRLLEEALLKKDIPYRIYGGISFFERKEVKDALAYIRFLVNPNDEVAFMRLVNTPSRGIGSKSLEKLYIHREKLFNEQKLRVSYFELMSNAPQAGLSGKAVGPLLALSSWMEVLREKIKKSAQLASILDEVLYQSGLLEAYEEEDKLLDSQRIENLQELRNSMQDFQKKMPGSLMDEYLQEISLLTSPGEAGDASSSVNLMTVHNAKGLEFEVVFILSLDDDIIPHYLSKKEFRYDEERRLLYVAITRAKSQLYMMRCLSRMNYGSYQTCLPSMFLSEIESSGAELQVVNAY